jgi:hydrogenase nickel incorporation protein HypA/HybF
MHETKFVNEIIFHVKDMLARHGPVKSVLVKVSLSPFSHVSPEGLKGAFELFSEIEKLKNVSLKIKPLVVKVNCKDCGNVFESQKITFHCSRCLSTNIDIKRDKEFSVDSIEVEEL